MKKQIPSLILIMQGGLRTLGYISCILQWLWVSVVALPPLLASGWLDSLTNPTPIEHQVIISPSFSASPVMVAIAGLITIIMLGLSLYILLRLPSAMAKTGERIVHNATESVLPVITHHKKLPVKKKRLLTQRVTFYIQCGALLLPFVFTLFLPEVKNLPHDVVLFIAGWLAVFSLLFFSGSFLLASLSQQKTTTKR